MRELISAFNVRLSDAGWPIGAHSGGIVQCAVLARELSTPAQMLIAANPVFGRDLKAADVHARLLEARDGGASALIASDELDELTQLADRLLVCAGGRIAMEVAAESVDRTRIGHAMAG